MNTAFSSSNITGLQQQHKSKGSNGTKTPPFIALGVSIVLTIIGAFLLYGSAQSKDWPSVTGEVTASELVDTSYTNSSSDTSIAASTKYRETIVYNVNGQDYTTTLETTSQQSTGSTIDVKYNPDNPSQAAIGDASLFGWLLAGLGVVLAITSIIWAIIVIRR